MSCVCVCVALISVCVGVYAGMWEQDRMQGEGELIISARRGNSSSSGGGEDTVLSYRGTFRAATRHGFGEGTYASGTRYVGHWCDDKPQGWGTIIYPNGDVGEGEFSEGVLAASGLMIFRSHDHHDHAHEHFLGDAARAVDAATAAASAAAAATAGLLEDSSFWLLSSMPPLSPLPLLADLHRAPQTTHHARHSAHQDSHWDSSSFSSLHLLSLSQSEEASPVAPLYALPPSQVPLRDDLYRGDWSNNFPHGAGAMDYSSGNVFLGMFCRGVREGAGVLLRKRDKSARELLAESADEDFGGLVPPAPAGGSSGPSSGGGRQAADLAMLLSHGALCVEEWLGGAGRKSEDPPLGFTSSECLAARNRRYLLLLELSLGWALAPRDRDRPALSSDIIPLPGATSFPYDIIRGVWKDDHLASLSLP